MPEIARDSHTGALVKACDASKKSKYVCLEAHIEAKHRLVGMQGQYRFALKVCTECHEHQQINILS
jgi:hypothetical protein